jgi:hypothetical protein
MRPGKGFSSGTFKVGNTFSLFVGGPNQTTVEQVLRLPPSLLFLQSDHSIRPLTSFSTLVQKT